MGLSGLDGGERDPVAKEVQKKFSRGDQDRGKEFSFSTHEAWVDWEAAALTERAELDAEAAEARELEALGEIQEKVDASD